MMACSRGPFKPTAAFCQKEEQVRRSIEQETRKQLHEHIGKLFKDAQYSDLQLCVDSRQIPVHSCILYARYSRFYDYCREHAEDNKVVVNGLSFEQLDRCLNSVYVKDGIDCLDIDNALSLKGSACKDVPSLSADLLSLLDGSTGDVEFIVEEKVVKAHKAVLASRSDYFAAMFSTSWKETSLSSITIQNISYEVFVAALKFLYGACQDVLYLKTAEVLRFSDMYGMLELQDLVISHIKVTKCHLFHKPCTYCIPQVYECLKLCEDFYHLESFKCQCIQWICKHFVKTLACKQFFSMSERIQDDVKMEIEKQLNASTALETWRKCTILITSVDHYQTKWTRLFQDFVAKIQATCVNVAIVHFVPIFNSPILLGNFLKEINYSSLLLEQFFNAVLETLTIQNCCNVLQGFLFLVQMGKDPSFMDPFDLESFELVEKSCKRCEKFVIGSIGQVSKTKEWKALSNAKQRELKDAAFFVDL